MSNEEREEKQGALSFVMACLKFVLGNTLSSLVVFTFYFSVACAWIVTTGWLGRFGK